MEGLVDNLMNVFTDELFNIIMGLDEQTVKTLTARLNDAINPKAAKAEKTFDPDLKAIYYEEFEEIFGDSGEEEATEELMFLIGREGEGSVEKLKYLSLWYNMRVKKGLYSGVKP